MKSRLLHADGQKTWAVVFEAGDEVVQGLTAFARAERLSASHFTAIGALSDVTLGFFDWPTKTYQKIALHEQLEVLSLVGDVTRDEDEPRLHAHVVVGRRDGTAHGGHLMEAHVRPTLEVIVVESPAHLHRRRDPETGLPLIRLDG